MSWLSLWSAHPGLLIGACTLLGLCVGSFANVVILRLPAMMEAAWKHEARSLLQVADATEEAAPRLSLWSPGSRCPHCGEPIKPWHNLPLLGWLWLRGRAACCGQPISLQYPLVELIAAALGAACAWRFGATPQLPAALALSWTLLILTGIDLRDQLLPDSLTLPLLWLGLLLNTASLFASPIGAILGAAAGYLVLWLIYHLFRLFTGKEGMGHGDFKLLAALGAWLGARDLPVLLLLASAVGASVGIALIVFRGHRREVPIAFGPYLAGAGWLLLMLRPTLDGLVVSAMRP